MLNRPTPWIALSALLVTGAGATHHVRQREMIHAPTADVSRSSMSPSTDAFAPKSMSTAIH